MCVCVFTVCVCVCVCVRCVCAVCVCVCVLLCVSVCVLVATSLFPPSLQPPVLDGKGWYGLGVWFVCGCARARFVYVCVSVYVGCVVFV